MRRYIAHLVSSMIAYALLLPVAIWLMEGAGELPARYLIALLPVAPVAFGTMAFIHYLGEMDELQRRIQLQVFGFSLGKTALVTFTLGFLERAVFPRIGMVWVLPMIVAFWGIGSAVASRRYR